jgi:hypothetical protein
MAKQNEEYVLGLCDEALGSTGLRQHRFDWLEGDLSPKTGRRMTLPVDAYWPDRALVVEFHEKQHIAEVRHFDKPDTMTVSGMHRGMQRKRYDDRRRKLIPAYGIRLVIIPISYFEVRRSNIVQRHYEDLAVVRRVLQEHSD